MIRSATGAGIPCGPDRPIHTPAVNRGGPGSLKVGTSGNVGIRSTVVPTSARTRWW